MSRIRVKLGELGSKLESIMREAGAKNAAFIKESANALPYDAQRYLITRTYGESGLGHISGQLRRENYPIVRDTGSGTYDLGLRNAKGYAAIHEFGGQTRAHVIEPREKKAGARHPVKRVNHPGSTIPARPFMRPALELAADEFIRKCMAEGGIGL